MDLLARLRAFCFPGGEDFARGVRIVRDTQKGEMCAAPGARWMPFTAEETIEARRSGFRWDARFGPMAVTDAYEEGRGRLVVKLGGVIPVKKLAGPEFDVGELQRYLGAIACCPPAILNNASVEWMEAGPLTLRVRDREGPAGATVDLEIGEDGRPLGCRADRPRMVGKQIVSTPWSASYLEFREWEGMRVASRLEAAWQLPEGPFTYFRGEVISYDLLF